MTTASILLTITILSSLQQQPDAFTLVPSHPIPTPTIRQSLHNNYNHPHQNDNTNQRPQRHGSILTTRFAALSIPVYSNIATQSNVTSTTTTTPIPIKTQKTMMTPPAATAVAILPHCIESSVLKKSLSGYFETCGRVWQSQYSVGDEGWIKMQNPSTNGVPRNINTRRNRTLDKIRF